MTLTVGAVRQLFTQLPGRVTPGLTEAELHRIEQAHGFTFNPDHRTFLRAGLPVRDRWPDWRNGDLTKMAELLAQPVNGVIFDVEENGFWWPSWGARPDDPAERTEVARAELARVPTLLPVYGHRYAPALPEAGLPVFSVMQTDVIPYGQDLLDFLRRMAGSGQGRSADGRHVPFWSELAG